ncbi:sodium:solute symporter family protein [Teredinibacter waterburyi]|jgi:Na+/proline symporter|uniref:sodium:solute symporter family protein n=1 Tax=Teredinibacter waterburyi TaxID=1500538 RepID=UPI00165F1EB7|nr:sodium:solute symporter family protein [Teredinibacter waterburyi]
MHLTFLDLSIIGLYLASTVVIGLALKRKASKNLDSYFLGGKTLPWYMLSLSNASGMFDISGTMWLVTLLFVYGLKSIWIPWLWPVFNQVFLMVFLSLWLRRSNVLTGAEWIRTRFGDDLGGKLSHGIIVVFALISVLGFLAYGFVGIGKFMEIFIPWETVSPYVPFSVTPEYVPHLYGIVFTSIATFYVMLGGMLSIVWADLLQFTIMAVSAVIIAAIAMMQVSPEAFQAAVPADWSNPFFSWNLSMDWSNKIPEVMEKINSDGYELFGIFVMMMLFKGVLISAAGPAPNYDMQKILATKSPREAAKMSGFVSVVLMPIRYLMIAGFTVLALVFYSQLDLQVGDRVDFENILPSAISQFAPAGVMGLLLAGLLAAFMSTFASTVNAAPAYLVNDIYRRYINPEASAKTLVRMSYVVSVAVVLISTCIGLFVTSINSVLQWIVSGLWGGYTVSNVLKWYWWRFNGMGYFSGMTAGIICAMFVPPLLQLALPATPSDILPLYSFPIILLLSSIAAVVGSISSEEEDKTRLKEFYKKVRPWGFWGPIHDLVAAEDPSFKRNPNFKRDMFNIAVGIILQTSLVALPIFFVIKEFYSAAFTAAIAIGTGLILWKTWFQNLSDWPEEEIAQEQAKKLAKAS